MASYFRAGPLAALLFIATPAAAQDSKDFKNWFVACDNVRDCSAYGFDVDQKGDARAYLRVERKGAATAPVKITIAVDYGDSASGYTLSFDDPALPGLPTQTLTGTEGEDGAYRRVVLTDLVPADTLIESMRKAQKILVTLKPAEGKKIEQPVSSISLSGAVAALLWIDDQQKRIDTVTAMIRRGSKPASTIPPQPKLPVVVAAKRTNEKPPTKFPKGLEARGRALCEENDENSKIEDVSALGGGQYLYQFTCPDSSGAYNFFNVFLIGPADNVKALRPVTFKRPPGISGDNDAPRSGLTNPLYETETRTLTSFNKGRGIGDCGVEEQWVWTGKAFLLSRMRFMSECYGVPVDDWPDLYRAEVK
jgi:hypothetical protein